MYFLYFHILCYAFIILRVNCYVLLAGNIDDFRKIARKFMPDNFAEQIEEMVQDTNYKYNRGSANDDESRDRTVEFSDESLQSKQDLLELITEAFKTAMTRHKTMNRYHLKSTPAPPTPPVAPSVPFVVPPGLTLDDIVEKVKQRLQQELINLSALANAQALNAQTLNAQPLNVQPFNAQASYAQPVNVPQVVGQPVYKNVQFSKFTDANAQIRSPVYDYKAPMNIVKEEVQYEATYEESQEKGQYEGLVLHSQPHFVQNKHVDSSRTKNVLPFKDNRLVNPNHGGDVKKVRYIKQIVVPAKLIQRQPSYRQQQSMVPQPSLVQQPSLIQQQKQKPNKIAQQKVLKNKQLARPMPKTILPPPTLETNEEAIAANLESAPNSSLIDNSSGNYVTSLKEETFESEAAEETTFKSIFKFKHNITTKKPIVPTVAEEEKSAEEVEDVGVQDPAGDNEATEAIKKPKVKTESISNEEQEIKPEPNATALGEVTVLDKTTKKGKMGTVIPFYGITSPNYYAKLPKTAEKYNFNEPIPEEDREPEKLKPIGIPPPRIGKVMLL